MGAPVGYTGFSAWQGVAMAILLIFMFLFAIATWLLASRRGRNGGIWFGIGLFLGPFALLAVAALPPVPAISRP
jgi:hypothetical protein